MRVADVKVSVLAYFVAADHLYCALQDHAGQRQVFKLSTCREVLPHIEQVVEAIEGACSPVRTEQVFTGFAREWGRRLLPPAEALASSDVLVIIPHSVLHGVPLHAIEHRPNGAPLAVTHGITYASSGTLFVRCVDRNVVRQFDPERWEFPRRNGDSAPPPPSTCRAAAVDVRFQASVEYERVAKLFLNKFEEKRLCGDRILIKPRRDTPMDADVFCIVCHGHYDQRFPGRSGLLLATVPGIGAEMGISIHFGQTYSFRDLPFHFFPLGIGARPDCLPEILTVEELMVGCSTNAQLIALIGCSTAAGDISSVDDFISLANQFLKIGATTTLASMWRLDFDLASRWIPRFLRHWYDLRLPKALAMRESFREELEEKSWPISEWAAPALFGDWL